MKYSILISTNAQNDIQQTIDWEDESIRQERLRVATYLSPTARPWVKKTAQTSH